MTESRQITYQGSGPLVRTLVQALEGEGVTVTVRRQGPGAAERRDHRDMGQAVKATLLVRGAIESIRAGVSTFGQRFSDRALVRVEDAAPSPGPTASAAAPPTDAAAAAGS